MTTTFITDRKDAPKDQPATQPPGSPRERLRRGVPLKHKDVEVPGVGRFRVRQIRQREIDDANEPLARREADDKGKITTHFDNRGHRARLIAFALINEDGSNVYADPAGEGAEEVGGLPKDSFDVLWEAFDELNVWSEEAKQKLGKGSAKATT